MLQQVIIFVCLPVLILAGTNVTNGVKKETFFAQIQQSILGAIEDNGTTGLSLKNIKGLVNIEGKADRPCKCAEGSCVCCTGAALQFFSINVRNRVCSTLQYDPDDFSLGVKIAFNDRVLFKNKVSGRNPPPICIPVPYLTNLRFCLRFSNVYFIKRNIHACLTLETQWNKEAAFTYNFDCLRMGENGFAVVRPEDGGGLPIPVAPGNPGEDGIEDYDENLTDADIKPPKT